MTVDVMCKIEEYIDENCRQTLEQICDRLFSGMGAVLSTSSMHRALQGMHYSIKKLRIEKTTMNSIDNRTKCKDFVVALNSHIDNGNMIIFQDETNLN
ncbi:Transposase [Phytophthora palmivora]|uniref:Transposase n=1 Tax=Phytophthora palmivora TaxID=4796 RepID=A0A2P4YRG0_9STRA|nr:Transposase [Phytophthora palmivora]